MYKITVYPDHISFWTEESGSVNSLWQDDLKDTDVYAIIEHALLTQAYTIDYSGNNNPRAGF